MQKSRKKLAVKEVLSAPVQVGVNVGEVLVDVGAEFRELFARGGMAEVSLTPGPVHDHNFGTPTALHCPAAFRSLPACKVFRDFSFLVSWHSYAACCCGADLL